MARDPGKNTGVASLPAEALYRRCDPAQFPFESTLELDDHTPDIGQPRAATAIKFSLDIQRKGYNLFALGPPGIGRHTLINHFLEQAVHDRAVPAEWCYVYNFEKPRQPRALKMPPGMGRVFQQDMEQLVESLRSALSTAFESEEYQQRQQTVQEEAKEEHEMELEALQAEMKDRGFALLRTPTGFTLAPIRDNKILTPEEHQNLTEEERKNLEEAARLFQEKLQKILRRLPERIRKAHQKLRDLNREVADYAVGDLIGELRKKYQDLDAVLAYLDEVREHLVDNVQSFVTQQQNGAPQQLLPVDLYQVNVLMDHGASETAPMIYEENPTYPNLIGKIEYVAQMGTLLTDFSLIRAGALHKANGGFLVLDALKVLQKPFAWEGLKRALRSGQIHIDSPGETLGLLTTVTLEPEPIPLDITVILVGEPLLYYMLSEYDPEFRDLFKVMADFDESLDRDEDNEIRYARLIAFLVNREGWRPLDKSGVARVVERSARLAGDAEKLSNHLENLIDLLSEADYWAGKAGTDVIRAGHIQQAIDAQIHRADRLREKVRENILRDTIYISTEGEKIGQINGLAVLQPGRFAFGKPNRITCRARLGQGEIVDIERETELGGPIHSKGVLILTGFLNGRYTLDLPLSLSASLVFEQSYGGIEGDSASCAELLALLSAIAEVPIRQSLAITGSVNQHGQVQPIGGVNEKIEGFFDVCKARGLTGDQGVVIAATNVKHLMLREDVVEAVAAGRFHIYPIHTVDEGIEMLTGLPAGERNAEGIYPPNSFNERVERRLSKFASQRQAFVSQNGQTEVNA